jgi:tetratricopeptide (TPR) repeat protein
LIQEAEGYLDLIMSMSGQLPLKAAHRIRLANRAIEALDQLDHAECCRGRAYYLRGQALRLMAKHRQAISSLRKAAEVDSLNVHIYLALAWCYKRTGRIDLAIRAMEEALEIEPERGILHYNLACYWSLASNVGLALAHLARAIDMNSAYRQLVVDEPDFDPVRHHPEFMALANLIV